MIANRPHIPPVQLQDGRALYIAGPWSTIKSADLDRLPYGFYTVELLLENGNSEEQARCSSLWSAKRKLTLLANKAKENKQ